jgi:TPR repeat protein
MQGIVRRVAAGLAAAVGSKVGKEAEELCASGQCATAAVALKLAVDLGHLPSRALLAHMMLDGREGVARDWNGAVELVEEGVRSGCHHCQGAMATLCYRQDGPCGGLKGDVARALELARESSGKGSKYGQYALGKLHEYGVGLAEEEDDKELSDDDWAAQVIALYRLAAAQGLAGAQNELGNIYFLGNIVAEDDAEALRWHRQAAAQGHPDSLISIGSHFECTIEDAEEAIRWYRRAHAAGHPNAAYLLLQLGVCIYRTYADVPTHSARTQRHTQFFLPAQ